MSSIFKIVIGMVLMAIVIVAIGAILNDQTGILTETGNASTDLNIG